MRIFSYAMFAAVFCCLFAAKTPTARAQIDFTTLLRTVEANGCPSESESSILLGDFDETAQGSCSFDAMPPLDPSESYFHSSTATIDSTITPYLINFQGSASADSNGNTSTSSSAKLESSFTLDAATPYQLVGSLSSLFSNSNGGISDGPGYIRLEMGNQVIHSVEGDANTFDFSGSLAAGSYTLNALAVGDAFSTEITGESTFSTMEFAFAVPEPAINWVILLPLLLPFVRRK